jgi:Holliday junction resolvase RusA-like endonuclease
VKSFTFFIPGQPKGQGRSRSRMDRPGHYPDPKSAKLQSSIAWIAHNAMKGMPPVEGPVMLKIRAVSRRPASWPKRRQTEYWKISKPDLDNIEKLLLDGLNRVAWLDDAQVCKVDKEKHYGDTEGVFVTVTELTICQTSGNVVKMMEVKFCPA